MSVWLVTREVEYECSIPLGVFPTEEAALEACKARWKSAAKRSHGPVYRINGDPVEITEVAWGELEI